MNKIDTTNSTRSENDSGLPTMVQKLGNTTYDVYVHFSKTSKETMADKVMRLIRNDIISKDIS